MNIFLTGGTGFIGQHLTRALTDIGHNVTIATRNTGKHPRYVLPPIDDNQEPFVGKTGGTEVGKSGKKQRAAHVRYVPLQDDLTPYLSGCDVVINLAGESLAGKRWTTGVKKRLYESRIDTTRSLVSSMKQLDIKPELFLSASAVGYYGDCGDEIVTEKRGAGDDFLAGLCRDWEEASSEAKSLGLRVVNPRIGVVLAADGGALAAMLPVFKAFIGGALGSGSQYFPWIHMDDLCRSMIHAIQTTELHGPYNATAPEPVTMSTFTEVLGDVLSKPSFFRVPEFALNMALGEAAAMVTTSLRVVPEKIRRQGFLFKFTDVREALVDVLIDNRQPETR